MSKKTKVKKERARKEKIRLQKHQGTHKKKGSVFHLNSKMKNLKTRIGPPTQEMFPDELHRYWVAHGINFLVSDYDNGVWDPMFPTLYEGATIGAKEIADAIISRFADQTEKGHWSKVGRTVMAWSMSPRDITYVYYREALRRVKAKRKEPVPTAPKDSMNPKEPVSEETLKAFSNLLDNLEPVETVVCQPMNPEVWETFKFILDGVRKNEELDAKR